jgi:hypothetical protein
MVNKNDCSFCGRHVDKSDCSERYMTVTSVFDEKDEKGEETVRHVRKLLCHTCMINVEVAFQTLAIEGNRRKEKLAELQVMA